MELVFIENNRPVTDSLTVAETFGKRHADVLRSIENLECSQEFIERNFALNDYQDSIGRKLPKYLITQDGFSFLVMGYTGKEAAHFKETYINEFNRMRDELNKPQFALPKTMPEALRLLAAEMESKAILAAENEQLSIESAEQKKKLKEQEAPVAIYNLAISAGNAQSMSVVAKALGTGRNRLFDDLRDHNIIMKNSRIPYQRFIDAGYFIVRESPRQQGDVIVNEPVTKVTAKGFEYIAKLLKAN